MTSRQTDSPAASVPDTDGADTLRLIGLLESPYVRRVAISMAMVGLPFQHEPLSVLHDYEQFTRLNPVVKAPSLILDDGSALSDSTLILEFIERLTPVSRRLTPVEDGPFILAQRLIGLALVACEKTIQIIYETKLRPPDKRHQPWLDRVERQARAAYDALGCCQSNANRSPHDARRALRASA